MANRRGYLTLRSTSTVKSTHMITHHPGLYRKSQAIGHRIINNLRRDNESYGTNQPRIHKVAKLPEAAKYLLVECSKPVINIK
ncbi:hypothetical protein DPMN_081864 [Dreissena polymorpha]|uniref:Uncharacterized protein n=1 Tax=Dreissena polymorpha TaxID=45954 RepID=A0A9D3Y9F1_DREPO|nr:hypothetical protein DPMN_081864 [Dreissena polymorpha]